MLYAEMVTYGGLILMFVAPVMVLMALDSWWRILVGTLLFWGIGLLTGVMARDLDPLRGISTWEWVFIVFGWIPGQFYCLLALMVTYARTLPQPSAGGAQAAISRRR